jgi:fused signal recognition particle receptor
MSTHEGLFSRIKKGLSQTRGHLLSGVEQVLNAFKAIDDELFEELEEALILADLGVETSMAIVTALRRRAKAERVTEAAQLKALLTNEISGILTRDTQPFALTCPAVIMMIGVNGVGKTTTIGKLTQWYKNEGKSVLIAAADTFRAAAIDQLAVWCERASVPMIRHEENSDPASVVFDAAQSAKAKGIDLLICDTAGRLHNKKNLMEELKKINRILSAQHPEAQREVFLALDATTGQNALQQAKLFKEAADITGIVLTKLDGTAKGGVVVAIKNELNIPVRFITVGEGIDDLQPFDAGLFARALFEEA